MRVLVVEDDPALGQVLRRGLVEDGYAVDLCPTLRQADEFLVVETYDLLVLDLGLPDGDGVTLCTAIRERGDPLPILMLTARDGLGDRVGGLDSGADDYLTKPFDFPELAARIRALLRRPTQAHTPVLAVGDLRLDPASHQVWRGDLTVPLTAKEFGLLQFLLRHEGQVVRRTELLEHVWDAHYDGLSNVVDVHMANLRRKLTIDGEAPPIETIRGVGYQLVSADG